jgi:hypothetical protein
MLSSLSCDDKTPSTGGNNQNPGQPADCAGALTASSQFQTQALTAGTAAVVIDTPNLVFQNSKQTECPISICRILKADCQNPSSSGYLTMSTAAPWILSATNKITAGQHAFCYQCEISQSNTVMAPVIMNKDLIVTVNAGQTDCSTALMPKQWTPPTKPAGTAAILFDSYHSVFENTNVSACPVTSCQVKAADCVSPFVGGL